jgi:VanZ like family/Concanavalin A-like lectin/glucanases superfamily
LEHLRIKRFELKGHLTVQGALGFICLILLFGLLYAGLHPFHAPANRVAWIPGANALRFEEPGTIFSLGAIPPPDEGEVERSLEIWAQPGKIEDSSTLVAFYSPVSSRQVSLSQAQSDLEVRVQSSSAWRRAKGGRINIGDAFRDGRSAFWAVTFGRAGTTVYRDGVVVKRSPLRPSRGEFSGRLVIANSPIFSDAWSGVLLGLAVYDTALDRAQIVRHYASWTGKGAPALTSDDACIALYLFNEHAGRVVHNHARSGNDLYIPSEFLVLSQTILDPVWRAFNWSRGFWQDALINVVGFIPFGWCVCACFSAWGLRRPALRASALGAAVSLLIELIQSHLPTRDSSMSDVIDNLLGSVVGAVAYRGAIAREFDRVIRQALVALNRI